MNVSAPWDQGDQGDTVTKAEQEKWSGWLDNNVALPDAFSDRATTGCECTGDNAALGKDYLRILGRNYGKWCAPWDDGYCSDLAGQPEAWYDYPGASGNQEQSMRVKMAGRHSCSSCLLEGNGAIVGKDCKWEGAQGQCEYGETKDNCESQCSSCDDYVGCPQGEFCNFDDGSSGFCEGCVADCYGSSLSVEGETDCSMNC